MAPKVPSKFGLDDSGCKLQPSAFTAGLRPRSGVPSSRARQPNLKPQDPNHLAQTPSPLNTHPQNLKPLQKTNVNPKIHTPGEPPKNQRKPKNAHARRAEQKGDQILSWEGMVSDEAFNQINVSPKFHTLAHTHTILHSHTHTRTHSHTRTLTHST